MPNRSGLVAMEHNSQIDELHPCQKISSLEPQGFQRINKNIFKIYLVK